MTDPSEEPSSLLDWVTSLATDPALRTRLADEPGAVLDEQGLADLPPADLHHSLPLVTDSVAARLGTEVDTTALSATASRLPGEGSAAALARHFAAATDTVTAGDPSPGPDDAADLDDLDPDTDHDLDDADADADAASPHPPPLPIDHTAQEATTMTSPTSTPGTTTDQHADLLPRLEAYIAQMDAHGMAHNSTPAGMVEQFGAGPLTRYLDAYQPGDRWGDDLAEYQNQLYASVNTPGPAESAPSGSDAASTSAPEPDTAEEFATDPDTQAANRQVFLDQKAAFNHFPSADAFVADARMADDAFLSTYSDYDARNDYSVENYSEHRVSHETHLTDDPDDTDPAGASTPAVDPLGVGDTDLDDLDGTGDAGTVQADDPTASGAGESVTVDGSSGEGAALPGWMSWDESTQVWVDNGDRGDIVESAANPTDAPGTPQGWHTLTLEAQSHGFPDAQSYLADPQFSAPEFRQDIAWEPGNRSAAYGELQAYFDAADTAGVSPVDYGAANTYTPEQIDAAYAAEDSSDSGRDTDLDDVAGTGDATDMPGDPAVEGAATPSWMSWDESQGLWVDSGSPDPGADPQAAAGGLDATDTDLDDFGGPAPAGGDGYVPHGDDPFGDMLQASGQGTGIPTGPAGDTDLDGFGSGSDPAGHPSFGAAAGGGESFGDGDASGGAGDLGSSTDSGPSDDSSGSDSSSSSDGFDHGGSADDGGSGHTDFSDHADSSASSDSSDDGGSDDAGDDGGSHDSGGESFG